MTYLPYTWGVLVIFLDVGHTVVCDSDYSRSTIREGKLWKYDGRSSQPEG